MKSIARALLGTGLLALLTGCGVTGHWRIHSIEPEAAKQHFQIHWMTLSDDGTYKACGMEGGQHKLLTGTYTYDAKEKVLTFKTDGKTRSYHAEVVGMGDELKVTGGQKGKEWCAIMKKACQCKGECNCPETGKPCPEHAEKKPEAVKEKEAAKPEAQKQEAKKAEPKKAEPAKKEEKKPKEKGEGPEKASGKKG